ncbi:hypothetical protein HUG20_06895 [Salicibibacter cibi]|uniref:Uncharacterized protein n=1 Tax=Salicibibacter cibi TaxID=2743001 RepID=A0A7T6ZAA5_9BACI|nr:hypothetical protein [Salicibibacter cibi]QQK79632.1 hypothetical protein HUG20_06895 [Salicibibacter cibi]
MTRIVERIYKDGIVEGKQEDILTYLKSRFELSSVDIQNKIENITDIEVLNRLIAKLYKAETKTCALQLIDEFKE